jgi:predicted amidophosphoribosyltransferase
MNMGLIDVLLGRNRDRLCPRCKEPISLELEECPKCGAKIKDMFVQVCKNCKAEAPFGAKYCPKCGRSFEQEKTEYICPVCGFRAGYSMTACPSCGQRFI